MARPLKIYMRGKSVRQLQNMLKQMGYPMEDQPATFGTSTRDGVKDFQKRKGLKVDGVVDDELMTLMQQSVGFQSESDKKKSPTSRPAAVDQNRLNALIKLLVSKGIITESELEDFLKSEAQSEPQVELKPKDTNSLLKKVKKTPGTPLF